MTGATPRISVVFAYAETPDFANSALVADANKWSVEEDAAPAVAAAAAAEPLTVGTILASVAGTAAIAKAAAAAAANAAAARSDEL